MAPSDEGAVAAATEGEKMLRFEENFQQNDSFLSLRRFAPPPSSEGGFGARNIKTVLQIGIGHSVLLDFLFINISKIA